VLSAHQAELCVGCRLQSRTTTRHWQFKGGLATKPVAKKQCHFECCVLMAIKLLPTDAGGPVAEGGSFCLAAPGLIPGVSAWRLRW